MDSIIHTAIKNGAKPHQLVKLRGGRYYFFLRQEMTEYVPRSHVVPSKGKFFDYMLGEYYNTLADWAAANDCKTDDICYGINRDYPGEPLLRVFISLRDLLKKLDPTWDPDTQVVDLREEKRKKEIHAALNNALNVIHNQVNYVKDMLTKL